MTAQHYITEAQIDTVLPPFYQFLGSTEPDDDDAAGNMMLSLLQLLHVSNNGGGAIQVPMEPSIGKNNLCIKMPFTMFFLYNLPIPFMVNLNSVKITKIVFMEIEENDTYLVIFVTDDNKLYNGELVLSNADIYSFMMNQKLNPVLIQFAEKLLGDDRIKNIPVSHMKSAEEMVMDGIFKHQEASGLILPTQ